MCSVALAFALQKVTEVLMILVMMTTVSMALLTPNHCLDKGGHHTAHLFMDQLSAMAVRYLANCTTDNSTRHVPLHSEACA